MGHSVSLETRKKIGLSGIGRIPWNKGLTYKNPKVSISMTGRKLSETHKKNIGKASIRLGLKPPVMIGEKNPNWIHDRNSIKRRERRDNPEYKIWRWSIWMRDGFKCRIVSNDCSGRIEAHHILGWSLYPELRYEINNGITLCRAHHPRKRAEEKRLAPVFLELVAVSR